MEPLMSAFPAMSLAQAHALMCRPGSPFEVGEAEIRGVTTKVWKNAPPTLREVFLMGRAHGARDFLIHEDERTDFEGFARATLAVAHALIADGVKPGDRVAIAMRNLPEWPAAYFGAVLAGAVATPLNAWWTGQELVYALQDSGAKLLIADAQRLERLAGRLDSCPTLERVWVARTDEGPGLPRLRRFEDVTGPVNDWGALPDRPLPAVELTPETDSSLFYTSGTTGRPKGAMGTHRAAVTTLMNTAFSAARVHVRRGEAVPEPKPEDPQKGLLASIPFFHTTGCQALMTAAFVQGAKLAIQRRWEPAEAMAIIARERLTHAGGVPTIAWQLIEHPDLAEHDLSSLVNVAYGGAPAAPELVRRIRKALPGAIAASGWGMTETTATFTHHQGEDYEHRPGSCGPAFPVGEMRIVGSDGFDQPVGEIGELWVKGPNVVSGYWNNPDATAATFVDGWLKTGDLARLDEEGFCYIVDRAKDMLIRGGENIYCVEVEDVLYEHPAVVDAALVGLPHQVLGEEPAAVVTVRPGAEVDEAAMRAFVAERLAAFKVPTRVLFWHEPLPRNANGKILKPELQKLFL
ncbi:AMP-binding protein [Caulobacter sp. 17J65-9]|uniref:class I adenylate-forming enzyme family protein n=1 Tax=Caulobacter sp. 17J65-9 TaxID=2709382 RepID=UPI0013CB2088|nr:AMP-binding protein [Caulobacter sp. 17J65-9]NEX92524.1 long-chain fatty acid--CoA ligase [Caulobacter sp. 17J65-9]